MRRTTDDSGFTLLELMATVAVIGILMAIAIPVLLGAQVQASETTARTRARAALDAARSFRLADGATPDDATDLTTVEPALALTTLMDTSALAAGKVFVAFQPNGDVVLAAGSTRSTTCFWAKETAADGSWYAADDCSTAIGSLSFSRSW